MDPDSLLDDLPIAEDSNDDTTLPSADPPADEGAAPPPEKQEGKQPDPDPKPDDKQQQKVAPKPEPKEKDRVPLATFLEQKSKFERQQAELKAQFEREQAALRAELEKLRNPPKPPPKYDEDPTGYIKHATEESAQRVIAKLEESQQTLKSVQQTTEQQQRALEEQRFFTELQQTEAAFVQEKPDYFEALSFVREVRVKQLEALNEMGIATLTEDQIYEQIRKEEAGLAFNVMRAGKNPSEVIYRLAGHYGYTPKQIQQMQKQQQMQVPPIKGGQKLDPDLTLGKSNGGAPDPTDDSPDPESWDPFEAAIGELWPKRR